MDRSDASALADLQMHWDEVYAITLDGDIWSARYHGSADELRAHTSTELRELIRSDYAYRQKADLIAYDPDGDLGEDADEDPGEDSDEDPGEDDDEATAGADTAGADTAGADTAAADSEAPGRRGIEVASFSGLRGERMSM